MKKMKAIEPLIAIIILIAVTVVIAIAVVGFIMGWWGTFGAVEQIRLFPDTQLLVGNNTATILLHVRNEGTASAVIYKVEIEGIPNATYNSTITLAAGQETTLSIQITGVTLEAGTKYTIKVYTRAGNVYPITVTAR